MLSVALSPNFSLGKATRVEERRDLLLGGNWSRRGRRAGHGGRRHAREHCGRARHENTRQREHQERTDREVRVMKSCASAGRRRRGDMSAAGGSHGSPPVHSPARPRAGRAGLPQASRPSVHTSRGPMSRFHKGLRGKKKTAPRYHKGPLHFNPGGDLLSHPVSRAVPSALEGLTSLFGMGRGVSPPPMPPETRTARRFNGASFSNHN